MSDYKIEERGGSYYLRDMTPPEKPYMSPEEEAAWKAEQAEKEARREARRKITRWLWLALSLSITPNIPFCGWLFFIPPVGSFYAGGHHFFAIIAFFIFWRTFCMFIPKRIILSAILSVIAAVFLV